MLSFIFTSFWLVMMINKIQSQYESTMNFQLTFSTTSKCNFSDNTPINLCLDNEYSYSCYNGQTNGLSLLQCDQTNDDDQCDNIFIKTNTNNNNLTLDCFYTKNLTWVGNQLGVRSFNECVYTVYGESNNNTMLMCALVYPFLTVTEFNNTQFFEEGVKYYKFPWLGFEVNKRLIKNYGIIIIVALIVLSCLLGLCCYGMCHLCYLCMRGTSNNYENEKSSSYSWKNKSNNRNTYECKTETKPLSWYLYSKKNKVTYETRDERIPQSSNCSNVC